MVGVGAPACVGLVLLLRRPDTRVAWILLGGALSVALVMAAAAVGNMALEENPRSATGAWVLLPSHAHLTNRRPYQLADGQGSPS